ncbi:MAG TPA: DsbA family oxidoreductase [Polyangiaceae bacterium]
MQPLVLEIWSDIACPWCFIGKRRFETALRRTEQVGPVAITWRAFQLDPSAPKSYPERPGHNERLARKYGVSLAEAEKMVLRVVNLGKPEGIDFDFDALKGGNTFDGHRLLAFARERGVQDALKERLLRAYFCEGAQISDPSTLGALALDVGLETEAALAVVASDQYAADVRRDQATAAQLGIRGVPFFKIGRYGVSGAQPVELLSEVLVKARQELDASEPVSTSAKHGGTSDEVCDVDRPC